MKHSETTHLSTNPFKPGAGHMPPYLAGREEEIKQFTELLKQKIILSNMVLTGLRGVGKTVLLNTFKPIAINNKWLWAGTDSSESACINEKAIALRLITDLAVVTSGIAFKEEMVASIGFTAKSKTFQHTLNYGTLTTIYDSTPGLVVDKLKTTLEFIWNCIKNTNIQGIIFAYDEAQTMSNHPEKDEYPLSILLDVFQSIQRKNIPFMLILAGLPTLFPQLVEARTFTERMFKIVFVDKLNDNASRQAILIPIEQSKCPLKLAEDSISLIIDTAGGYPYFIQFICREVFDAFLQKINEKKPPSVPIEEITRKLDRDFFSGRWARATDRQKDLLELIAKLDNSEDEFTVQEVVNSSKQGLKKPFASSHANQLFSALGKMGLIYKNRHGKYSFAVPLLGRFILRQLKEDAK